MIVITKRRVPFTMSLQVTIIPYLLCKHPGLGISFEDLISFVCSQTPVDNWFKRIRETNQTFFGGIKPEGSAVRVAILDTGINEKYPELQVNQIKDKWSFNPSLIEGHEDLDGHGSHAAAVLLRVAPNCTIYIARVFKDTRDVNAQNFAYINKVRKEIV